MDLQRSDLERLHSLKERDGLEGNLDTVYPWSFSSCGEDERTDSVGSRVTAGVESAGVDCSRSTDDSQNGARCPYYSVVNRTFEIFIGPREDETANYEQEEEEGRPTRMLKRRKIRVPEFDVANSSGQFPILSLEEQDLLWRSKVALVAKGVFPQPDSLQSGQSLYPPYPYLQLPRETLVTRKSLANPAPHGDLTSADVSNGCPFFEMVTFVRNVNRRVAAAEASKPDSGSQSTPGRTYGSHSGVDDFQQRGKRRISDAGCSELDSDLLLSVQQHDETLLPAGWICETGGADPVELES